MDRRDEFLATVASLYYKLNQSQSDIAARLDISVSTVSRLIREARERRIVEFLIRMPIPRDLELEQVMIQQFGLKDVYILQSSPENDDNTLLNQIGMLATTYIERIIDQLHPGSSVGVAWGTGVHAAISAISDNYAQNIDVVQLLGGVGASLIGGADLSRIVAQKLGGRHYDLLAPVIVERPIARQVLLAEPTVREALLRAKQAKLAITGIGTIQEEQSSFLKAGLLTSSDLAHLKSSGIVGEICGCFFDIEGQYKNHEINERIIGIELDDLRQIQHSIAIARDPLKVQSILGALRGRFVKVLATDDITARGVLKLAQQL